MFLALIFVIYLLYFVCLFIFTCLPCHRIFLLVVVGGLYISCGFHPDTLVVMRVYSPIHFFFQCIVISNSTLHPYIITTDNTRKQQQHKWKWLGCQIEGFNMVVHKPMAVVTVGLHHIAFLNSNALREMWIFSMQYANRDNVFTMRCWDHTVKSAPQKWPWGSGMPTTGELNVLLPYLKPLGPSVSRVFSHIKAPTERTLIKRVCSIKNICSWGARLSSWLDWGPLFHQSYRSCPW